MTNEKHLEEILMDAHKLKIKNEVFDLVDEISKKNPTMSMVDLFDLALKTIKNNGIISNTSSQEI
jgi:hypothetical protein